MYVWTNFADASMFQKDPSMFVRFYMAAKYLWGEISTMDPGLLVKMGHKF